MQKVIGYFTMIGLFLLAACAPSTQKVDIQKEKEAVKLTLDKYVIANESQNIDLIEEIWYPSEEIVSFGTENGEKLDGITRIKDAVQKQFRTFKNTYISSHDLLTEVSDDGNTAWFSMIVNYNFILENKAHTYEGLYYTGVLKKKDGKWKLVQTHMSVPITPIR